MIELAQLVPNDIDFSILASLFGSQGVPMPYIEIAFIFFQWRRLFFSCALKTKKLGSGTVFSMFLANVLAE